MSQQTLSPPREMDYEDSYAQAVQIVRGKYGHVSGPYRDESGERVCDVESLRADDLMIFMLAWGSEIAYENVAPP
jgi:hypothetical protein